MVILFKRVIIIIIIIIILTISLVFSVSYSVPKRKKNTKTMKTGRKQRARRRPLRRENSVTTCQYPRSYVYVYERLLGSLIFRPSSYFTEEILVSLCYWSYVRLCM